MLFATYSAVSEWFCPLLWMSPPFLVVLWKPPPAMSKALLANLAAPPLQSERDRQDVQESAGLCRACGISMFQTGCVPVTFHLLVVVDVLDLSWLYLWRHMTPPHRKWWAAAKDSTADSTPKLDGKSSDAGAADFWAPSAEPGPKLHAVWISSGPVRLGSRGMPGGIYWINWILAGWD